MMKNTGQLSHPNISAIVASSLSLIASLASFVVCAALVWWLLASQHFFYSVWYEQLNIHKTIEVYAPQNRFDKADFSRSSRQKRHQVFAQISDSVNNNGKGLADIFYIVHSAQKQLPENKKLLSNTPIQPRHKPLLTSDEILHLQDVANLIAYFKLTAAICSALLLIALMFLQLKKQQLPTLKKQLATATGFIAAGAAVLFFIGTETVFYQLHHWVFPDNHPWFFYYQDSLMSTLMKAPVLFAPIGVMWLALTLCAWGGLQYGLRTWLSKR